MSEDRTREFPNNRSFEERVFVRFDAMEARFESRFSAMEARFDSRFDALDSRVQALETKALDTKPIWERALAEILEVKQGVQDLNRKIDVLNQDVLQVRADQRGVGKRMDALESSLQ
jgi:DNA repair exonuclease SbcCD ATPase subunit